MMQRVVAASYLSNAEVQITNPGNSNDCKASLDIISRLGAKIKWAENSVIVDSSSSVIENRSINCGESGLGIRMFTPIIALNKGEFTIHGEGSLVKRPMPFFNEVLPELGTQVSTATGFVPFKINGPLIGASIEIDGSLTSQFLTGLLMALPIAKENSVIKIENLRSVGYVQLTLDVLKMFSVNIEHNNFEEFRIKGNQEYKSSKINIQGDWSGAAFHLVGGAISGNCKLTNLQSDSSQPDKAILDALVMAGADVQINADSVIVRKSDLKAFDFNATDSPDLFPPLAALAANCSGVTKIQGTNRLKHKESNRAATIQSELLKLGVRVELKDNEMHIHGGRIIGGAMDSCNDHRIAMMGAILAINAEKPVEINNHEAINKSYPEFFDHYRHLNGEAVL